MEALIFILGMVVLIESAAIIVLRNESRDKSKQIVTARKRIDDAITAMINMQKVIQELKETIRELRKSKTNKN